MLSITPTFKAYRAIALPAPALHIQIKALHEGVALGIVKVGKFKADVQAGHGDQGNSARLAFVPMDAEAARFDLGFKAVAGLLPRHRSNSGGEPALPFFYRTAHFSVEFGWVVALHEFLDQKWQLAGIDTAQSAIK